MNAAQEKLVEDFRSLWGDFCVRCEAAEAAGKWNVEEDGMMEAFFESDLMSVLLDAVSSDGVFGADEAELFSKMMDEKFTSHDLAEMYREVSDVVEAFPAGAALVAVPRLAAIDAALGEDYRQALLLACAILEQADGKVDASESELADRLRTALE